MAYRGRTVKRCVPSAVWTMAPKGMTVAWLLVKRENVTWPVAVVAGRRVSPKSAIQLSRSLPVLVAARVSVRST